MSPTVQRIGWILLFVFLLPAVSFSVYEINSLNENEKALEEIYRQQLDAILFSVNQYADDVVREWAQNLDMQIKEAQEPEVLAQSMNFRNEHPAIQRIFLIPEDSTQVIALSADSTNTYTLGAVLDSSTYMKQRVLDKLQTYLTAGYRKIEAINHVCDPGEEMVIFALNGEAHPYKWASFLINPDDFVELELTNKLQEIARDKFILTVSNLDTQNQLYTSDPVDSVEVQVQNTLWILPNHFLGIAFKGETLQNLVQDRFFTNLAIIAVLNLLLLAGVIWVFSNIQREVKLAQVKSEFVSNVSHEIRTPLALISMFAETLEMGRVSSESRKHEYYTIIHKESKRLSGIVNKILNFSQIEAGKKTYLSEPLHINEVVEEIADTYRFHLTQQGFTFEVDTCDDCPLVEGDREAISEVIVNLLDNAKKYSDTQKHIRIRTKVRGEQFLVEVIDRGVGIAPENLDAIFEKFYRVGQRNVHNTKGTGLGLALVHHIMKAHEGDIEVESTLGKGSIFRLVFPVKTSLATRV
ncbi:MAG: ATP-binding protein [Bacteroidota bacterium]